MPYAPSPSSFKVNGTIYVHYRRKETKNNILLLSQDLHNDSWEDVFNESDANEAYEKFLCKLSFYYNKNIPLVRNKPPKRSKHPWITKGILKSIKTRNHLYRLALNSQCNLQLQTYQKYRNKLTSIIRLSRKMYYSEEIESNNSNVNALWSTVNDLLGKSKKDSPDVFLDDNCRYQEPEQISNAFNTYFTNIGPTLAAKIDTDKCFSRYLKDPCENSLFFVPTNICEITNIVLSLKNSKSSGFDEISVGLLKQIIHYISPPLCHIFNLSLSNGQCPVSLKVAKVIPVFKNKGDPSEIKNYRPISLLPSMSKILEKIVYKRLYNFLEKNDILTHNQFGFRQGHSTELAIIQLCNRIIESFVNKKHTIGVFMDLSKAFDTIDHSILLYKLKFYGVRGTALHWFEDYLSNRKQFVFFQSKNSHISNINCGVPQGSILGPLLFLIYVNDIIHSSPVLSFTLFADDTNVLCTDTNPNTLEATLNNELINISQWFKCNKLSLNIEKTNFIHFRISRSNNVQCNINIENIPLIEKKATKFLGITLESTLSWTEHIQKVHSYVSRNIGILYKLQDFLNEKSLFTLYNGLVLPHINYCNIIWGNCGQTKINSILLLQKKALRIVTHSPYRASTEPLFSNLKTLKINEIHTLQTGSFMFKYSHKLLPRTFHETFHQNSSIHSYPTRRSNDYHLENPKTTIAQRSVKHHGPDIWNSLPAQLKSIKSLKTFKVHLKSHLLSEYDTE